MYSESSEPQSRHTQQARGWHSVAVGLQAAATLCERELVRFFRQRNRVVGALGQPLIFWALLGAGLRSSFRPAGAEQTYAEYFFPGVVVLTVLFTAIFATISIIEDRREGFLQGVLIAPVGRPWIVLGKVAGGAAIAIVQAWLLLALAPIVGIQIGVVNVLLATVHLVVLGMGLTSLGVCLAWKTDSVQGFHAIMTVLLMPMWLLSGAFFPAQGASAWLSVIITINPLTYGVAGLRHILYLDRADRTGMLDGPDAWFSFAVTVVASAISFALACRMANRVETGDT